MGVTVRPLSFLRRMQLDGGSMAREKRSSARRRRRWPWVLLTFGLLVFVLVGLALLAKPMLQVKPEADMARDELAAAQDALQAEDLPMAKAHVAAARTHVEEASQRVNGFGGDVWRWVPVAGGAVKDVRHLVGALDQATSLAEVGTEVYPDLMQSDSLVQDATVDLEQLEEILSALERAGQHLHAASEELDSVNGNTPLIGEKVLEARDAARERIEPLRTTYDDAAPVLDALPDVLGADGERTYILAIMNPAELRYSGGATLTLVPMTMTEGKVVFADTLTNEDVSAGAEKIKWPKVKGNPFHSPGKTRVVNATFSPYWSQSGEELLRAWEVRFGEQADGVIAVDLQALARLMELTGPVQAEGIGELNSGNLVKVLAGSYDTYDSPDQRQAINAAVVPAFREKLFQGGQFAEKFQVLADAAKGRHFAMYFRDERVQQAFVSRGLSGDLSETDHDYLGVFTQNTNSSKSDYWQRRIVDSDVDLKADGSAEVTLTVTVQNPSPPWVHADDPDPSQDPKFGYYTRWAGNAIAAFLPRGAEVQGQATIRGLPFRPIVRSVLERPYFYRKVTLPPGGQAILKVTYRVPNAATVDGDSLVYQLDVDPQATVVPQAVNVTLHVPRGYSPSTTPLGWSMVDGRTLKFTGGALDEAIHLEVPLSKL
jgi:hypothetical protein